MSKTTIKLDYPVESDGNKINELTMRRATVRDQKVASKAGPPEEQEITLFANLCEVANNTIEALDLADYKKVQEAFTSFLSP